jgi:SAM-dependent methyltransferase
MFLEPLDFAKMYKEHKQKSVFKGKSSGDWDEKSKELARSMQHSSYVEEFISRMDIRGDEVVLDIGCGPGTLAIPLAKRVKQVIAIDFSKEMLSELEIFAKKEGVRNVTTYHLGWDDDWGSLPKVDISVASRSVEVHDIERALHKLNAQTRRACYVTYKAGGSFVDMNILDFIGKKIITKPDFWYIPLLLYKNEYLPYVDYIATQRGSIKSANAQEFVESLIWSLGELDAAQQEKAKEYYEQFIVQKEQIPKPFTWAFIAWSTQKESLLKVQLSPSL